MVVIGAGEKLEVFISYSRTYSRTDSAAFADEFLAGLRCRLDLGSILPPD
jgi:hypothetical protein